MRPCGTRPTGPCLSVVNIASTTPADDSRTPDLPHYYVRSSELDSSGTFSTLCREKGLPLSVREIDGYQVRDPTESSLRRSQPICEASSYVVCLRLKFCGCPKYADLMLWCD